MTALSRGKVRLLAAAACLALIAGGGLPDPAIGQAAPHSFRVVNAGSAPIQVATGPRETVEIVLPSGGTLIVAPGSTVSLTAGADGTPEVTVASGLVRVASGAEGTLIIRTPRGQLRLVRGAAMVDVTEESLRTHLLYGEGLQVSAGGQQRLIYRPGFEVTSGANGLTTPRRMTPAEVAADLLRLSIGLTEGTPPGQRSSRAGGGSGGTVFRVGSSGQGGPVPGNATVELPPNDPRPGDVNPPPGGGPPVDGGFSFAFTGDLGIGGVSVGDSTNVPSVPGVPSGVSDVAGFLYKQNFDDENPVQQGQAIDRYNFSAPVRLGPITNHLAGTANLTRTISGADGVGYIASGNMRDHQARGVVYFQGVVSGGLTDAFNSSGQLIRLAQESGLVRFPSLPAGGVFSDRNSIIRSTSLPQTNALEEPFFFLQAHTTFAGMEQRDEFEGLGDVRRGRGVVASGLTFGTDFSREILFNDTPELSRRDNFLFLDTEVLHSFVWSSNDSFSCAVESCNSLFQTALDDEIAQLGGSEVTRLTMANSSEFSGAVLIRAPSETRRYIFATGGLDEVISNPIPGHRIDRFHLSSGMDGDIRNGIGGLLPGMHLGTGSRAFQRAETWTDLATGVPGFDLTTAGLSQTDFYIVNPDGAVITTPGAVAARPKLLYADVGLVEVNGRQVSTISVTIGEVRFRFERELLSGSTLTDETINNETMVDAILDMRTVGSSRGLTASRETSSALHVASDFTSTAAGGGNPNLTIDDDPDAPRVTAPGRLGFFVLENAGLVFDDVEDRGSRPEGATQSLPLPGGTEQAVGSSVRDYYAALRLGVAVGSDLVTTRDGVDGATGYAAGIVERETRPDPSGPVQVTLAAFGAPGTQSGTFQTANVAFSEFDHPNNTFVASINGWLLGGDGGLSAYVDDDTYGARSEDGKGRDLAMVSGAMVAGGISSELQTRTAGYQHVKWGFFFGDTNTTPGQREHTHLSSYAAGRRISDAEETMVDAAVMAADRTDVRTATVTYNGHLIGTVAENGGNVLRTVGGTYRDSFNFGSRQGSVTVGFDGRTLTGSSSASASLAQYGSIVTGGGLTGELNGHFIAPVIPKLTDFGTLLNAPDGVPGAYLDAPAGVVGAFSLSDGAAGGYRAVGTFAGE